MQTVSCPRSWAELHPGHDSIGFCAWIRCFVFSLYQLLAAYYTENRTADPVASCPLDIKRVFNPQHFTCTNEGYKKRWKKGMLGPVSLPFFTHGSAQLCLTCQVQGSPDSKRVPSQSRDIIHFPVKRLRHIFNCLGLFLDSTTAVWGGKRLVYFLHRVIISVSRETTQIWMSLHRITRGEAGLAASIADVQITSLLWLLWEWMQSHRTREDAGHGLLSWPFGDAHFQVSWKQEEKHRGQKTDATAVLKWDEAKSTVRSAGSLAWALKSAGDEGIHMLVFFSECHCMNSFSKNRVLNRLSL